MNARMVQVTGIAAIVLLAAFIGVKVLLPKVVPGLGVKTIIEAPRTDAPIIAIRNT